MKTNEAIKLIDLQNVGDGFVAANDAAQELLDQTKMYEVITVKEVTKRDVKFHRAYFSLLKYIYQYLPIKFKEKVPEKYFYQFLKHLKGEYDVLFTFKDGTKLVEYESIAFGNMSQKRFEEYIKEQLPWIYENVIGAFFEGDVYDNIVETIEMEYVKFLSKL